MSAPGEPDDRPVHRLELRLGGGYVPDLEIDLVRLGSLSPCAHSRTLRQASDSYRASPALNSRSPPFPPGPPSPAL
jgi:hypothetical protein